MAIDRCPRWLRYLMIGTGAIACIVSIVATLCGEGGWAALAAVATFLYMLHNIEDLLEERRVEAETDKE